MALRVREKSVSASLDMMRTLLTPLIYGTTYEQSTRDLLSAPMDISAYPLHRKIPIFIHERLIANSEERNMPRLDRQWGRIDREQLDVQGIQFICSTRVSPSFRSPSLSSQTASKEA